MTMIMQKNFTYKSRHKICKCQLIFFCISPENSERGIFCHISQIAYSGKSPSFLGEGMKGKKDKKSKVHPLFPSSHHDIYARAHTHMTPDNTRDKRGLTKDLVI